MVLAFFVCSGLTPAISRCPLAVLLAVQVGVLVVLMLVRAMLVVVPVVPSVVLVVLTLRVVLAVVLVVAIVPVVALVAPCLSIAVSASASHALPMISYDF